MNHLFGFANAVAFSIGGEHVKWSDLLGNMFALATVGFALRRSILTWPVQIAGCVLLFGANMGAHLGGGAARQVALAVAAGYGWYRWSSVRKGESAITVRWASWSERAVLAAALGVGTVAFAWLLTDTRSSWAPWPDAYIFIGSWVATGAQAKGYIEFWFVWIAVDVVGVPLAVTNGLPVSGMVYGAFFVMVLGGMRQWMRQARSQAASASQGGPASPSLPSGRRGLPPSPPVPQFPLREKVSA